MINEFEKTIQLVDDIDKLVQDHMQHAVQEEEKIWSLRCKSVSKVNLKAKHEFLIQAKKEHLKIIKFSLDKLAARHQEELEKEERRKPKF